MAKLTDISYIKPLLKGFGFTFSKQLGQNFLIDETVCPQMAAECGAAGGGVIEIGPGIGVLTKELASVAKKVVAIELDKRLQPVLDVTLAECDNVKVIMGDALKLDLAQLIKDEFDGMDVVICANLPYYITSPLIMSLLEKRVPVKSITVMVQSEAGERICAECCTRKCGAVTVAVRAYSEPKMLFKVGRESFLPSPNVDSAVIRLDIKDTPDIGNTNPQFFTKTVRAAFSQRRKQLANSLSGGLGISKEQAQLALLRSGIPDKARAEQLSLDDYKRLTDTLFKGSL